MVKGNTVIPLKMFINEKGWAKILIALAQGKKLHDKRNDLKEKDDKRDMDRAMKR
jgi:SsrA-binding protein